jgi:hypothetical protein
MMGPSVPTAVGVGLHVATFGAEFSAREKVQHISLRRHCRDGFLLRRFYRR